MTAPSFDSGYAVRGVYPAETGLTQMPLKLTNMQGIVRDCLWVEILVRCRDE